MVVASVIAATIQSGDVTHHQDHEIAPATRRIKNTTNTMTGRLKPMAVSTSSLFILFFGLEFIRKLIFLLFGSILIEEVEQ